MFQCFASSGKINFSFCAGILLINNAIDWHFCWNHAVILSLESDVVFWWYTSCVSRLNINLEIVHREGNSDTSNITLLISLPMSSSDYLELVYSSVNTSLDTVAVFAVVKRLKASYYLVTQLSCTFIWAPLAIRVNYP